MVQNNHIDYIIGVGRGGFIPSTILSHVLDHQPPIIPVQYSSVSGKGDDKSPLKLLPKLPVSYISGTGKVNKQTVLIVDDIVDSGHTMHELKTIYANDKTQVLTLALFYRKTSTTIHQPDFFWQQLDEDAPWVCFPWEN